jgi:hypothetical protein
VTYPESNRIPLSGLRCYRFCSQHRALPLAEQAWDGTAWHGGVIVNV